MIKIYNKKRNIEKITGGSKNIWCGKKRTWNEFLGKSWTEHQVDKYDQNRLYELLKELISISYFSKGY